MLSKVKNNYSLLNNGEENSAFDNLENKYETLKTKNLRYSLKDNFRNYRKNNSAKIIYKFAKNLKPRKQKLKLFKNKNNSFLDVIKISPKLNLEYKIELYDQKGRYSLINKDEIIDEKKYNGQHFIKQQYKDSYSYKTSLNLKGKTKFYIWNQKSISYGKFRSSKIKEKKDSNRCFLFDENTSFNINKYTDINNSITQIKSNNNKKLRTKNATKSSSNLTNQSRLFSDKKEKNKNYLKSYKDKDKAKLDFKNKCMRLRYQINKTFEKARNASIDLNKDIYESRNYDKLNKLEGKPKKYKKDKILKYINLNESQTQKENINDLYKYLDIEKNVDNKIIKSYKYYDKFGKKILKKVIGEDKKQQHFLNKYEDSKNIILNSRFLIKKLQNELGILGANILATKKKYKGESAIQPHNEIQFLQKLIKENSIKNLNDEEYLDEITRRKNINEFMTNKIKKRLLRLQQKSLSIRNRPRESDYTYL